MAQNTSIEWTQTTWNPVTGCTKTSPGCANCYAERMARRLLAMGQANYANGFRVTTHEHMLKRPLEWRDGQRIFVNSMSDLFHRDVPTSFIRRVFDVMVSAEQHIFQVLTKRSQRLADLAPSLPWPENVWVGVSVESADYVSRMDNLRSTPAAVRFVSFEPLLGSVGDLDLQGIEWAIVGGESGPGARPMEGAWALDIRNQCKAARVPFFFKQWGGARRKEAGRVLDGHIYSGMPESIAPTPGASREVA